MKEEREVNRRPRGMEGERKKPGKDEGRDGMNGCFSLGGRFIKEGMEKIERGLGKKTLL